MKYILILILISKNALAQLEVRDGFLFITKVTALANNTEVLAYGEVNESALSHYLKITNVDLLKQTGFEGITFLKVKFRARPMLEKYLFLNILNRTEQLEVGMEPDFSKFDSLKKERLKKTYNINENSPNDSLEMLLSRNDLELFYNNSFSKFVKDVYLVYIDKTDKYYTLNQSKNTNNINDLINDIKKHNLFIYDIRNKMDNIKNKKERKKIYNELYVAEIGDVIKKALCE